MNFISLTLQMELRGDGEAANIKNSLNEVDIVFNNSAALPSKQEKEHKLPEYEASGGPRGHEKDVLETVDEHEASESFESSSSIYTDEDGETGISSIYCVKRADGLGEDIEMPMIEDITRDRKSCSRPKFMREDGNHNYSTILGNLYMKPGTKAVRKEIKLKLLVEEFFSALDKFVCIANYRLKDVDVEGTDVDLNFSLSWIRRAFHWLGIDSAKHYANKSPGPYNGWNRDISFLMNRYFFSPEFNNVNGFNIEESMYGGYQFVENAKGGFSLVYVPYPGYYDVDSEERTFCSTCDLMLPVHLNTFGNEQAQ